MLMQRRIKADRTFFSLVVPRETVQLIREDPRSAGVHCDDGTFQMFTQNGSSRTEDICKRFPCAHVLYIFLAIVLFFF